MQLDQYQSGALDLMEFTGTDPKTAVALLMKQIGLLKDEVVQLKEVVSRVDDLVLDCGIKVSCKVCDDLYTLDYEPSLFNQDMSYCGKSEWCCP